MNIVLLRDADWTDATTVRLYDYRAQHLNAVLKVTTGQCLRVGQLNGMKGSGRVEANTGNDIILSVDLTQPPPPRHPIQLVLALPRPKMLRRVLRTIAEFGVADCHLINAYRVEKSYWQSPYLSEDKVEAALIQGLERSGDTVLPRIHKHPRFKPFMEDDLRRVAAERPIVIAHPGDYPTMPSDTETPRTLLLGPEGGFIDYEVALATSIGASPVSLGRRVLSVDTAVCSVLAREMI